MRYQIAYKLLMIGAALLVFAAESIRDKAGA